MNAETIRLALACIGAGLVGYGGWLHYAPLGYAVAGALLFTVAVVGTLRAKS
jgi:hypothetical protein